jgi:hypothetical protein
MWRDDDKTRNLINRDIRCAVLPEPRPQQPYSLKCKSKTLENHNSVLQSNPSVNIYIYIYVRFFCDVLCPGDGFIHRQRSATKTSRRYQ